MGEAKEKTPLIILGSGTYSAVLIDTFRQYGDHFPYALKGLAQNVDPNRRGETVDGYPVYSMEELAPLAKTHHAHCLLGDCTAKRRFVEQVAELGFRFATLEHPGCRLIGDLNIGEGCYLGLDTCFFRGTSLGKHCTVLTKTVVGEDVRIGDYGMVCTGVMLAGHLCIGEEVFVGVGATITEHLTIGNGAIIGAGAVVVRDVPEGAVVVGNPAREIQRKGGPLRTVGDREKLGS
jgi:sugar O-acyltransferase (sialic acid O-acetyltransferase NeuD family)